MTRSKTISEIQSPVDLEALCRSIADLANNSDTDANWPDRSLELCGESGVFRWFVPVELGGMGWSAEQIVECYLKLSAACLNTTFVITQQTAAVDRICNSQNVEVTKKIIPDICTGKIRATVGISHLTTSRQHAQKPALVATRSDNGFVIDGYTPWVTAAPRADWFVMGATTESGQQLLFAVERLCPGVEVGKTARLMAITGSETGPVHLKRVSIDSSQVLAGPAENLMAGGGGRTGGLPTSTLATGLAGAAIGWIEEQSGKRKELVTTAQTLRERWDQSRDLLLAAARGSTDADPARIREVANRLVIDATSAALLAAKGAGFVQGHPVERWCRQAMFFLVWSCPANVQRSHLMHFSKCDG